MAAQPHLPRTVDKCNNADIHISDWKKVNNKNKAVRYYYKKCEMHQNESDLKKIREIIFYKTFNLEFFEISGPLWNMHVF